jgi:hypothetical protein
MAFRKRAYPHFTPLWGVIKAGFFGPGLFTCGSIIRLKKRVRDMDNSIIAYVIGVTYANADGSNRQEIIANCKKGDDLILLREPNNPYDKSAIKVCTLKKQGFLSRLLRRKPVLSQLGYLSEYVASKIVPLMDDGVHVQAVVSEIEQSEKVETGHSGTVIESIQECLVEISAENIQWDTDRNPVLIK